MKNFPADFIARTRSLLGEETMKAFLEALQCEPPVSIRMNRAKCASVPPDAVPVPWATAGYYLHSRPAFTFDPLFHAGCYYVQEASSMFLEQVLRAYVHAPAVMLDLCAAPGGKSTLARAVLPEGSLLVANEVVRSRSQVLAENIMKWGDAGVLVTNNDPADFAPLCSLFDVILADVPCSGEGMFRKDPVAVDEWSVENVSLCQQRQRRILRDVWGSLKPGGLLVYSTCTYNREEDEDNVSWIARELGAEVLPVEVRPEWNVSGNLAGGDFPVYRFLPHRAIGEGLFMAVLRKDDGENMPNGFPETIRRGKKNKRTDAGGPRVVFPKEVRQWVKSPENYVWQAEDGCLNAFPLAFEDVCARIRQTLKVIHAGLPVAVVKGKDCIPDHALALSSACHAEAFPYASLTYSQAIAYLRKEALVLDSAPRGYVLVTYRGIPFGFVKNLGNRANNLYPQEWRIRSTYLPESLSFPFPGDGPVCG